MGRGFFSSIVSFVYLVVGAVIANSHKYFTHLGNLKALVSAALAIVLWPLIILGVNFHLH
jgi:hypothetical protein